jgi:hypothetical protein
MAKKSWVKIGCSDTDLAVLREVAAMIGADNMSAAVRIMAREKWRELNKSPALPTTSKGRRARV